MSFNYLAVGVNQTRTGSTVYTVAVTVTSILFAIGIALKFIPRGKGGIAYGPITTLLRLVDKLKNSKKAGISAGSIVILVIAFFVFAILGSMALNQLFAPAGSGGINSSVSTTVKTVATTVVGILFAIGVALKFIPRGKG
jgi:uncharacterized sodium:solute symporter family permease YidK